MAMMPALRALVLVAMCPLLRAFTATAPVARFSLPAAALAPSSASHVKRLRMSDAELDDDVCEVSLPAPSWRPPSREEMVSRLESEEFDILVIGGGAVGSGVAMDAATRGLRVAQIEKNDFASGTSSRSTKLIHGGLRYLAQAFQKKVPPRSLLDVVKNLHFKPEYLKIVATDLGERGNMLRSAPFMATPLPMLVPLYLWWEVPLFGLVGFLYDLIAGTRRAVPPSRVVSADEARFTFPALSDADPDGNALVGALVIHDGQQNDARMCMHIVLTAIEAGAACVNYAELEALTTEGGDVGEPGARVSGAIVRERIGGREIKVRAKQVVNACGVFSDAVRSMAQPGVKPIMSPSFGTHLVLPEYDSARGAGLVWFTNDGRVLYLLPWEGSTIAGTTDKPGDVSFQPQPTQEEVDFILGECNRVVRQPLGASSVRAAWTGVRPLVADPNAPPGDTKSLSREHVVESLDCGLVTIAGGKWTTYRKMAQDAVDACVRANDGLSHSTACVTEGMQLIGCDRQGEMCGGEYDRITAALRDDYGLEKDMARHLRYNYGTHALKIVELGQAEPSRFLIDGGDGGFRRLHPLYAPLTAEVAYACRHEFAETAVDVLAHRTRLSFLDSAAALEALPRVLSIMAEEKSWNDDRVERESERAKAFLAASMMPPPPSEDLVGQVKPSAQSAALS